MDGKKERDEWPKKGASAELLSGDTPMKERKNYSGLSRNGIQHSKGGDAYTIFSVFLRRIETQHFPVFL